jgi:DNA anti-recombination protein RmuC
MSRSKNRTDSDTEENDIPLASKVEQLSDAVRQLADHVQVLGNALDEFKDAIRWGLQNDKFRSPENPTIEPVEIDHEQIDATIRDACSEVSGEASDAVREGLREELRELRDSLDQYSLDAQWAARKIREKPTEELNELRETLQGEIVDLRGSVEQFMTEMHDAVTQIHEAVRRERQRTLFDSDEIESDPGDRP